MLPPALGHVRTTSCTRESPGGAPGSLSREDALAQRKEAHPWLQRGEMSILLQHPWEPYLSSPFGRMASEGVPHLKRQMLLEVAV